VKPLGLATALLLLPGSAIAATTTSLEAAVAAALGEPIAFARADVDLNQDAHTDAIVLLRSANWCGSGGCTMLIFKGTASGYSLVSRSTITAPPIRVLPTSQFGWSDLVVHSNGTGDVVLRFDGAGYPSNPSLQTAPTAKQLGSAVKVLGSASNNSFKVTPDGAPQLNR
jgi:hypothetical protein